MKRNMRNNENRSGITDGKLVIEINSEIFSRLLYGCFIDTAAPLVIVVIDNKNAVFSACGVVIAACGKPCRACGVMVALNKLCVCVIICH